MKFSVAAILSAVASTVYAQAATAATAGIAVNLPSVGQVLNAGGPFQITWTVDATNPNPSTTINSIALMKGNSANLDVAIPNILSAAVPVNPPSYNWNIPATVETNPSYVLVFAGSNGATTYSTYFTIIGAAPGTVNTTAPSAAPVVPSAGASPSQSGATNSTKPSASGSGAASASPSSAASSLKAGLVGAAGVAGAVALLL